MDTFISIFPNDFKAPQGWKLWSLLPMDTIQLMCELLPDYLHLLYIHASVILWMRMLKVQVNGPLCRSSCRHCLMPIIGKEDKITLTHREWERLANQESSCSLCSRLTYRQRGGTAFYISQFSMSAGMMIYTRLLQYYYYYYYYYEELDGNIHGNVRMERHFWTLWTSMYFTSLSLVSLLWSFTDAKSYNNPFRHKYVWEKGI